MTPDPASSSSSRRSAKRRKVTRACDACKSKKKACTGTIPCRPCVRAQSECKYNASYSRGAVVTPQASDDACLHHVDASSPVETASAGGGSAAETPYESQDPDPVLDVAGQYCGPASAHSFLGRAVQNFSHASRPSISTAPPDLETSSSSPAVPIFSYGDRKVPEVDRTRFHWPDVTVARELVRRYFDFAAPTYRILHQGTVDKWVDDIYHPQSLSNPLSAATQAALLMVFATSLMFRGNPERIRDAGDDGWLHSELYYAMAESSLAHEVGMPTLGSVQARFLMVLYLLCSSRANQSWFTFGTVVQLLMCLGLHRYRPLNASASMEERVTRECEKRVIWCAYTLDKYLSLILGRPRFLQEEDIDQELPAAVDDDDLGQEQPDENSTHKDCIMNAPILHALLARILSRAAKEQYAVRSISDAQQMQAIESLSEAIEAWHAQLPPILSGAIQPSSLIPLFRRQLTVLQLARFHAIMFVTRPLLLRNYAANLPGYESPYRHYLTTCVAAARDAVSLILSFAKEEQLFPAFWYSQYIAFNALSAIYIYLIQMKRGRIPPCTTQDLHENVLYELAETTQHYLAQVTVRNAPSWRYSAILQGLRGEVNRVLHQDGFQDKASGSTRPRHAKVNRTATTHTPPVDPMLSPQPSSAAVYEETPMDEGMTAPGYNILDPRAESLFGSFAMDSDPSLNFWPQLDCLPISAFPRPVGI